MILEACELDTQQVASFNKMKSFLLSRPGATVTSVEVHLRQIKPVSRFYFDTLKGGQAPGDLREAFESAIDTYLQSDKPAEALVEFRGRQLTLHHLCGLLWNCSDLLPQRVRRQIADDVMRGDHRMLMTRDRPTYAQAARALREYGVLS